MAKEISEDTVKESSPRQSTNKSQIAMGSPPSLASQRSVKSERKIGDSSFSTSRRESRKLSRLSETVTVISDCLKMPDTCVLCGNGIPYSKCLCCENEGHNRCIEAFFCTIGRRVNLNNWRCPKCVTLSNMNSESRSEKVSHEESKANQVDLLLEIPNEGIDCPFCQIDMEFKDCECQECINCRKQNTELKRCGCDQENKSQMLKYNKCLQYRDFSTKIEYKYLEEEDQVEEEEEEEDSIWVRICWSVAWFLLLITFAFPIAIISSLIFIITYCFEACCHCCHPVCCFFLDGIKLPGTCCRGICSGDPMCTSNDHDKFEKC